MKISQYIKKVKGNLPKAFDIKGEYPIPPEHGGRDKFPRRVYTENGWGLDEDPLIEEAFPYEEETPDNAEEIGREVKETTEKAIEEMGTEAIAFYAPFHLTEKWGIYLIEEMLYGEAHIIHEISNLPFNDALNNLRKATIEHEIFHFRTEFFSLIAEDMTPRVCPDPVYIPYMKKNHTEEEALANASMFRLRYIANFEAALMSMCDNSPEGYRDYRNCLENQKKIKEDKIFKFAGTVLLAGNTKSTENVEYILANQSHLPTFFPTNDFLSKEIMKQVPIYSLPVDRIEDIRRIKHVLSNKRPEDLLKCLKNIYGCTVEKKGKGSHFRKIKFPNGNKIPFPKKSKGIQRYILNQVSRNLNVEKSEILKECFKVSP